MPRCLISTSIRRACATLLTTLLLSCATAGVLPNDATVDGKSLSDWTAEWFKWYWTQPSNNHPVLDPDGRWATNKQPAESVFYLTGTSFDNGRTFYANRHYSVPEDTFLFTPLRNEMGENIDVDPPWSSGQIRDALGGIITSITDLHITIDGVEVPDPFQHRLLSPVYSYIL